MEDISLLQTQVQSIREILQALKTLIVSVENEQKLESELLCMVQHCFRQFIFKEHFLAINTVAKPLHEAVTIDKLMRLQGLSIVYFDRWTHHATCLGVGIDEAKASFVAYADSLLCVMQCLIKEENKLLEAFDGRIT